MTVESYSDKYILPQLVSWGDASWRDYAACKGYDTNMFFPERGNGSTPEKVAVSKSICMRCPSRVPCLQFAIDNNLTYGTYGGVAPHDRRAMQNLVVTEDTVKVHIKDAYKILRRAKVQDVHGTLAELFNESRDWVRKALARGRNHFI